MATDPTFLFTPPPEVEHSPSFISKKVSTSFSFSGWQSVLNGKGIDFYMNLKITDTHDRSKPFVSVLISCNTLNIDKTTLTFAVSPTTALT